MLLIKSVVRDFQAFLRNPKELIHFVGEEKKNPSVVQELDKTNGEGWHRNTAVASKRPAQISQA